MKKTTEEELNRWRYDQKRAPVSLRVNGDERIAQRYFGEAKSLLWSVKNALSINKLMQGEGQRKIDGTVIRVKCVYGLDIIEIDTSKSTLLAPELGLPESCSITFINLPLSVPPMKDPGVVKATEIQGVDYFKTYYVFTLQNCPTCREITWDLLFNYANPVEPRHYLDEINNHSVYSLSPPAWAEIIDHGQDGGGYYIIWKAYTESGTDVVYSRTGLAIMRLVARIKDNRGKEICTQNERIEVDCCLKELDARKVEIWWKGFYDLCEPHIDYNGDHICLLPNKHPIWGLSGLLAYGVPQYLAKPLYSIPDIKGSCLPVEWSFTGPIRFLWPSKKNDETIRYAILTDSMDCHDSVTITLKDRCGREYEVLGLPCCGTESEMTAIQYTTLVMGCNQQQQFTFIGGGCPPYNWSVSGGGTITQDGLYTSPSSNYNCLSNPTIILTDCCGNTKSVKLAINCYAPANVALMNCGKERCETCHKEVDDNYYAATNWWVISYDCDGDIISSCITNPTCDTNPNTWENCFSTICSTAQCGNCGAGYLCALVDKRSTAMKNAGCCPLNPLTGLPYD